MHVENSKSSEQTNTFTQTSSIRSSNYNIFLEMTLKFNILFEENIYKLTMLTKMFLSVNSVSESFYKCS